jgi:hypothetical protein
MSIFLICSKNRCCTQREYKEGSNTTTNQILFNGHHVLLSNKWKENISLQF